MPRPAKPPRLHLRKRDGRDPVFVILDRGEEISTGFGLGAERGAEEAFQGYLARKHESAVGTHNPSRLPISDVLDFYGEAKEPGAAATPAARRAYDVTSIRIGHLLTFFGTRPISDIRGELCRDYVAWRGHTACRDAKEAKRRKTWPPQREAAAGEQTSRRELNILSAAVNLYHKEYTLEMVPVVTKPALARSPRRALTHHQAAALLAGALGFYRDADGVVRRRAKFVWTHRRRTRRFMIIGFFSGSRHSVITTGSWLPSVDRPWIDVDGGVIYRRGSAEAESKKRRPPMKIPPQLLGHLRRWREADMAEGIIDVLPRLAPARRGERRKSRPLAGQLRKGWAGARADAMTLSEEIDAAITPHFMRHTAGTWLVQGKVPARVAADYLGMSEEEFERTYYTADPDYQLEIGPAFAAAKARSPAPKNRS